MSKSKRIDRRQFIVAGSAAVAGLATGRLQAQSLPEQRLYVGFAPQMTRGRAVGRAGAALFAAEAFGRTEASFIRTGARFTISGMRRASHSPLRVRLDVMYTAEGLEEKVPFHAWAYEGSDSRASSPIAFHVPVDAVAAVEVVVTVGDLRNVVALTVAPAEGVIALNAGSYVFAIADGRPDWSSLTIAGETLEQRGRPVSFDYLILSVSSPS